MNVQVKAYAKLNLTLDITGAKNGFHLIDSVVTTVDIYDLISVSKRKDRLVTIAMHGLGCESIPYENNNTVKAAQAFIEKFNTTGADITVYKNIPMGAGMGGSSADAAGVLNALKKLYKITDEEGVIEIANSVGSDTAYMLKGGYARLTGRGEEVKPINSKLKLDFLIFLPKEGVSTAECYKRFDKLEKTNGRYSGNAENALLNGDVAMLCKNLNNDLFAPAISLCSAIKTEYENALCFSPEGVNMTGSGSAVYVIFQNAEFCRWAQSRYFGKARVIQTKTVIPVNKQKND